jgi:hypothetical protein
MQLVYLSPVPLTSFAQRPHHFVQWFHHRFNARVLWLDPTPARFPKWGDWRRLARRDSVALGPAWAGEEWVEKYTFPSLPIEPLAWGRAINGWRWQTALRALDSCMTADTWLVVGKPGALALELARRYPQQRLVFDAMDNMSAFCEGRAQTWMLHAERELAARADWIVTSSSALQRKFAAQGGKVRKVMNGLSAPTGPAASSRAAGGVDVLGYVGVIASWFDWEAVIRLAGAVPDKEIRLIGPCEKGPGTALPPNVRLYGAIAHDAVYAALREFSVGLIPFRLNALTEFVDPVKYYEYRAIGLPVLSTKFGEMKHRTAQDGVFFLEDFAGLPPPDALWRQTGNVEQCAAFCRENSWDRRFDAIDFLSATQVLRS